ncbi:fluoride efflux transporter CrcB [Pseudidiomarina terrestris]|uniref:fluoride efflux transporter CrcB n=1 Tax=Pseudidiomarina terrestris TaxID=2820060 RepID=UPI0026561BDF|nr:MULTISPECIES: fluoride efflux transporter CrcB [unclassified Pseudidiomarina]MDN7126451.1 fluoride efflux transporter CrcB [Pseudidiomarina sp. 1APR75-33.1]MDN7135201.1 fluoride efflux transporter CrcB [Pseudidiomarina sp. 1ASP75-5]MDN7137873.1 fluoride efflux transporter CrcB [Pseudidiomarina sp. 1ASP75-14]MEA3587019.1 fluoride efflux transporter CrcB [Pseudidiomarina sp. 1APP75-27a]
MSANLLAVALGGALGAMARYGVALGSLAIFGKSFPFGTLIVNIVGSFLLALLFLGQQQGSVSSAAWLFFGVGVLGAFTTFSAFSLEVVLLLQAGETLKALAYASLNVVCCIAAVAVALGLKTYFLSIWN